MLFHSVLASICVTRRCEFPTIVITLTNLWVLQNKIQVNRIAFLFVQPRSLIHFYKFLHLKTGYRVQYKLIIKTEYIVFVSVLTTTFSRPGLDDAPRSRV